MKAIMKTMNMTFDIVRQRFEEVTASAFVFHPAGLDRKSDGEYIDSKLEDHWQTFQEAWEECASHKEKIDEL